MVQLLCEKGECEKCAKSSSADIKVREGGGGRGAADAGAEALLQPLEKDAVEQFVFLQAKEDHDGAGEHALKEAAADGKEPLPGAWNWLEGAAAPMLELLLKS